MAAPPIIDDDPLPPGVTPSPPAQRRVGIGYSTWHRDRAWGARAWGTPVLGFYRSDDHAVIRRHARWIAGAGIDFVLIDWSNDLDADVRTGTGPPDQLALERATLDVFEVFAGLDERPNICLMIGFPGEPDAIESGRLQAKADQVHDQFVADARFGGLLERYLGRPLLVVYVGSPTPFRDGPPPWSDDRFTVRFMSGFVTEQPFLWSGGRVARFGYWSWEDRGEPTYPVFDGHPEAMAVVAAWWPGDQPSPGRMGGAVYVAEWERARRVGPRFVLAGTFNEWARTLQSSPDVSKDIEPSRELGFEYLAIARRQSALFKSGR